MEQNSNNINYFSAQQLEKLIEFDKVLKETYSNISIVDALDTYLKKLHLLPNEHTISLLEKFKKKLPIEPGSPVWKIQFESTPTGIQLVPVMQPYNDDYIQIECKLKEGLIPSKQSALDMIEKQQKK